jgi:hypothetical protein
MDHLGKMAMTERSQLYLYKNTILSNLLSPGSHMCFHTMRMISPVISATSLCPATCGTPLLTPTHRRQRAPP